jgi:diguanylate cyclase (GGDEF)-like protein
VFRSDKVDRDVDDELQFHIEERIRDLMASGLTRESATEQATRLFGSPLRLREESRDVKILPWLDSLLRDLRLGARMLRKNATVTATAVLSLALALGALAAVAVRRIRLPLQATVQQATALTERRFITISEPVVPELREVTRAMNTMVARLKGMFDEQAAQVEQLRRQANCDALTGLSNRAHFMGRLKVMLGSEDGSAGGAIVLVRLADLQGMNRKLGHPATDRLLQESAAAIVESARRAGSFEVGRLNGSDFAMVLPEVGSLREPAVDVAARLREREKVLAEMGEPLPTRLTIVEEPERHRETFDITG